MWLHPLRKQLPKTDTTAQALSLCPLPPLISRCCSSPPDACGHVLPQPMNQCKYVPLASLCTVICTKSGSAGCRAYPYVARWQDSMCSMSAPFAPVGQPMPAPGDGGETGPLPNQWRGGEGSQGAQEARWQPGHLILINLIMLFLACLQGMTCGSRHASNTKQCQGLRAYLGCSKPGSMLNAA